MGESFCLIGYSANPYQPTPRRGMEPRSAVLETAALPLDQRDMQRPPDEDGRNPIRVVYPFFKMAVDRRPTLLPARSPFLQK